MAKKKTGIMSMKKPAAVAKPSQGSGKNGGGKPAGKKKGSC